MYQVAKSLDLDEETMRIVANPRAFNISTLERLVDNASFGPSMGIVFDEFGHFTGRIEKKEFQRAYKRIVSDIANEEIDSRTINTDVQIRDYLTSLGRDSPNLNKRGSFTSEGFISDEPEEEEESNAEQKPKRFRRQKGLIPPGVKCRLTNPRIEGLYKELRRLSVADYPNSCGVTFRVFFELLVANYLDKTGLIKPMLAEQVRKNSKTEEWYPTFRQTLTLLLAEPRIGIELNPQARKFFKQMATDKHHLMTIDRLDQFVHNKFGSPTEAQLREFWEASEELIKQLLVEPSLIIEKEGSS